MKWIIAFLIISLSTLTHAQGILHKLEIKASEEDAEQKGEFVNLVDFKLGVGWNLGEGRLSGLYFRDAFITSGAEIQSAYLHLTTQNDFSESLAIRIRVEDSAYPSLYDDSTALLNNRAFVPIEVRWNIPNTSKGKKIISPNLASALNQLILRPDWEPSSNINLILEAEPIGNDTQRVVYNFYSYDQNDPERRPQLRVFIDSAFINSVYPVNVTNSINAYPNPAQDHVNVVLSKEFIGKEYHVFDIMGKPVLSGKIRSKKTKLDLHEVNAGIYFFKISGAQETATRIIKQ
ncbi:MAG: T9SS type A sorting domain-containing protein [Salibacteraceae bacterium]